MTMCTIPIIVKNNSVKLIHLKCWVHHTASGPPVNELNSRIYTPPWKSNFKAVPCKWKLRRAEFHFQVIQYLEQENTHLRCQGEILVCGLHTITRRRHQVKTFSALLVLGLYLMTIRRAILICYRMLTYRESQLWSCDISQSKSLNVLTKLVLLTSMTCSHASNVRMHWGTALYW